MRLRRPDVNAPAAKAMGRNSSDQFVSPGRRPVSTWGKPKAAKAAFMNVDAGE
jgi:hypothetical protein